jgi:hypothetical protein
MELLEDIWMVTFLLSNVSLFITGLFCHYSIKNVTKKLRRSKTK